MAKRRMSRFKAIKAKKCLGLLKQLVALYINEKSTMRKDLLYHFAASAMLYSGITGYCHFQGISKPKSKIIGIVTAIAVGSAKELLYDKKGDWPDMGANCAGIGAAHVAFSININKRK